jgi:serine/threonine-protein kinase
MSDETTFGKYRLIAELGHGGMADVFLAVARGPEGLGFSKLSVVKRLRPNLAEDPEFISMLVDEARVAARLNHPNCIQTYEIGETNHRYFIAMEFLEGQPLNRLLTRARKAEGKLTLPQQVSIICDVLAGLHHAHELRDYDGTPLGIVHRDVTPQNVFVTYEGNVKVVDFGIAKAAGRATETRDGIVKGKVQYMSPEQATGMSVDRRSDLFAVGVMLWEMATGERLWKNEDGEMAVMSRLIAREIPRSATAANPAVPSALDEIIVKALAPEPDDRYATAEEFEAALEKWFHSVTGGRRPSAKEIGGVVASLFEDRRQEARAIIEEQLAELKVHSSLKMKQLGVPVGPASVSSTSKVEARAAAGDPSFMRTTLPPRTLPSGAAVSSGRPTAIVDTKRSIVLNEERVRRRNRLMVLAGVVAVVGVVGVAKAVSSHTPPTAEALPPTPTTTPVTVGGPAVGQGAPPVAVQNGAPSAAETSTVAVRLEASPSTAQLLLDGRPYSNPFVGPFPRDHQTHHLEASAPGFRRQTQELRFESDVDVRLALERLGGVAPSRTAAVAPPPVAQTSASTSDDLRRQTPVVRPRRTIDETNPFAQ